MRALVTGGYFDEGGDGVIWEVNLATERAEVRLRWTPPRHLHVPTKGFAGGSIGANGQLYVAAHAAVVRVDLGRDEVTGLLHQPCMNDLHHVTAHQGQLYVANTGLGAVDIFSEDGTFTGSHALLPAWANARRIAGEDPEAPPVNPGWEGVSPPSWVEQTDRDPYFSKERQTQAFHQQKVPDHLHANHVCFLGGRPVATCFSNGSLLDLSSFQVLWRRPDTYLHDGVLHGESLWLTAIDGTVFELSADDLSLRRALQAFKSGHHGWCRGLAITDEHLLIGLTEVRRARMPRHRWADRAPEGSETSVLLLDREDGRLLARVDLSDAVRHSKLYSVLPMEDAAT